MKNNITIVAQQLIAKLKKQYPLFTGRTTSIGELQDLQKNINIKLPEWYFDLYSSVNLIDAEFGFREFEADGDYDGISFIIVGDIKDILDESLKYSPGMNVLEEGYIFFGSCSHGSGDPIFLNIKIENEQDPPVFRIYHDDNSIVQISNSLSELFNNAKI
ncbi:MAG: SMI1/KNR4 family protein [Paenibacillus sp.]|nr:SMI1/KNR4 family protein [Paenibacillus sp.]